MDFEQYTKERLWSVLVETVHNIIMYPHHKAYTREVILNEKPDITPTELAVRLKISLGEALVILYELTEEKEIISKSGT
jgi:transcription initiation factor IIE alpha subunit